LTGPDNQMHNFTKGRMPPRWLSGVLARIHELAAHRRVHFTLKALQELAGLDIGLDGEDACDVLGKLKASEFLERLRSRSTGEAMYVFRPDVGGSPIYVKMILRMNCVVISFHEDKDESDENE
jgi:hypothetical protein